MHVVATRINAELKPSQFCLYTLHVHVGITESNLIPQKKYKALINNAKGDLKSE